MGLEHSNLLGMDQPLDELDVSGCSSHGIETFFVGRAEHVGRVGNARVVAVGVGAVAVVVAVVELVRFVVEFETVQIVVVVVVDVVVDVAVVVAVAVVAVVVSEVEVEARGIQRMIVVVVVVSVVLVVAVAAVAAVVVEGGVDAHDVAALAAVALFVAAVVAVEHLGTVEYVVGTVVLVEQAFFVVPNELDIHDVESFFRTRKPGNAPRVRSRYSETNQSSRQHLEQPRRFVVFFFCQPCRWTKPIRPPPMVGEHRTGDSRRPIPTYEQYPSCSLVFARRGQSSLEPSSPRTSSRSASLSHYASSSRQLPSTLGKCPRISSGTRRRSPASSSVGRILREQCCCAFWRTNRRFW